MSPKSQYGIIAIIIHWCSALLILFLLATGFRASGMESSMAKAAILQVHLSINDKR